MDWTAPRGTEALVLALLKPQLCFSLGRTRGNGTLEAQGCNSMEVNFLQYFILPYKSQKIIFLGILQEFTPTSSSWGTSTSPQG